MLPLMNETFFTPANVPFSLFWILDSWRCSGGVSRLMVSCCRRLGDPIAWIDRGTERGEVQLKFIKEAFPQFGNIPPQNDDNGEKSNRRVKWCPAAHTTTMRRLPAQFMEMSNSWEALIVLCRKSTANLCDLYLIVNHLSNLFSYNLHNQKTAWTSMHGVQ